jgi:hypothetical protein
LEHPVTVIDSYAPRGASADRASNDNTLMNSGAAQPADALRGHAGHLPLDDQRLSVFTCVLVWALLAILGWGAIALFIHFI